LRQIKIHQSVTKAVIPAAGLGTRFLPATKAQPKEMLPVGDKPAIQYVVEETVAAGINDILIVTGRGKRTLEDHFDRSFELEHYLEQTGRFGEMQKMRAIAEIASMHYVRQAEPQGLGHAISCAYSHIGNNAFCVALADDFILAKTNVLTQMIECFKELSSSVLLVKKLPKERLPNYGVIAIKEKFSSNIFQVSNVVEKPQITQVPSEYAIIGRYLFTPTIFECLNKTQPGKNGEIHLTDAIAHLILTEPVYAIELTEDRFDLGNKLEYVLANVAVALKNPELRGPLASALKKMLTE
jgi:UTP--glucose-1-phosphate uridylyltransferase